jgi:glyoxylase-like metal-dependent hydrolase (beta-lactamase superfamily II)
VSGVLPRGFRAFARPDTRAEQAAVNQIRKLGFQPTDVRDIIVTHLDVDHAGGLSDFPQARVHLHAAEHSAAMTRSTLREKLRYIPAHWAHSPKWVLHDAVGEPWNGFDAVRNLGGLPPEVLAIPLPGHTRGHWAIAVRADTCWLLHAGDLYANKGSMDVPSTAPIGIRAFERLIAVDYDVVLANQARVRSMAKEHGDIRIFCAHDADEFDRLATAMPTGMSVPP